MTSVLIVDDHPSFRRFARVLLQASGFTVVDEAAGLTDRGISERLYVTPKTIETHIRQIFGKLGIPATPADNRRVHAVIAYLRSG